MSIPPAYTLLLFPLSPLLFPQEACSALVEACQGAPVALGAACGLLRYGICDADALLKVYCDASLPAERSLADTCTSTYLPFESRTTAERLQRCALQCSAFAHAAAVPVLSPLTIYPASLPVMVMNAASMCVCVIARACACVLVVFLPCQLPMLIHHLHLPPWLPENTV